MVRQLDAQPWHEDEPMHFPVMDALCPATSKIGRAIFVSAAIDPATDPSTAPTTDPVSELVQPMQPSDDVPVPPEAEEFNEDQSTHPPRNYSPSSTRRLTRSLTRTVSQGTRSHTQQRK